MSARLHKVGPSITKTTSDVSSSCSRTSNRSASTASMETMANLAVMASLQCADDTTTCYSGTPMLRCSVLCASRDGERELIMARSVPRLLKLSEHLSLTPFSRRSFSRRCPLGTGL